MSLLTSYADTNVDTDLAVGAATANTGRAQGFKIPDSKDITCLRLWLKRVGNDSSPGTTYAVRIETDSGGLPSGTVLGTALAFPDNSFDLEKSTYDWVVFRFSPAVSLTGGVQYHLVLMTTSTVDASNHVDWGADQSSPSYADGRDAVYNGTSWSNPATAADFAFEVRDDLIIVPEDDSYLDEQNQHLNATAQTSFPIGVGTGGKGGGMLRAVLQHDLSGDIPPSSTINSADLCWGGGLTLAYNGISRAAILYRCTQQWASNFPDWVHYDHDASLSWATAGGNYGSPTSTFDLIGTNTIKHQRIDIQAHVQDAIDNRSRLLSLLARRTGEAGEGHSTYQSREASAAVRPYFRIDYTAPAAAGFAHSFGGVIG